MTKMSNGNRYIIHAIEEVCWESERDKERERERESEREREREVN